jgi:hypothetical protein
MKDNKNHDKWVMGQVKKALDQGYSKQDIEGFITGSGDKQGGYESMESFNKAVVNRASTMTETKADSGFKIVLDSVNDFLGKLAFGATAGFSDHLLYDSYNQQSAAEKRDIFAEKHPELAMINSSGTLAGAILLGSKVDKVLGKTKLGKVLEPVAGQKVLNWGKNVGRGSGLASTEAGLMAMNEGKDSGDVALQAAVGGVGGAAVPAVMPLLKFMGSSAKQLWKYFRDDPMDLSKVNPKSAERDGLNAVKEVFEDKGKTLKDVEIQIRKNEDLGLGDETLGVDLLDDEGKALLRTARSQGTDVSTEAAEKLGGRVGRVKTYIQKFFSEATGSPERKSMLQYSDELAKQAKKESSPHYKKAFFGENGELRTIKNSDIDDIFFGTSAEEFAPFYNRARKLLRLNKAAHGGPQSIPTYKNLMDEYDKYGEIEWPVIFLDRVKKAVDKTYKNYSGLSADEATLQSSIIDLKKYIVEIVDTDNLDYAQARKIYKGKREIDEARELGSKLWDKEDVLDKIYTIDGKAMSEAEQMAFRTGAFNAKALQLESKLGNPKGEILKLLSEQDLQKLKILIPDETAHKRFIDQMDVLEDMTNTKFKVMDGSQTDFNVGQAAKEVGQEKVRTALYGAGALLTKNPYMAVSTIARDVTVPAQRIARMNKAGSALLSQGGKDIRKGIKKGLLVEKEMERAGRKKLKGESSYIGGYAGGSAGLTSGLLQ